MHRLPLALAAALLLGGTAAGVLPAAGAGAPDGVPISADTGGVPASPDTGGVPASADTAAPKVDAPGPKAQAGQIALRPHAPDPERRVLPRGAVAPGARSFQALRVSVLGGLSAPAGAGSEGASAGGQMGLELAYYPTAKAGWGVSASWSDFGPDWDGGRGFGEFGLFARFHFHPDRPLDPYLRLHAAMSGIDADGIPAGGIGVGAGVGMRYRIAPSMGLLAEGVIQDVLNEPGRTFFTSALRVGLTMDLVRGEAAGGR